MIIDVSNLNTIPVELEQMILSYLSKLPQEKVAQIKAEKIEYENDVRCAIENYVGPFTAECLYKELISIMERCDLICYHSTKVLSRTSILRNGLIPNEWGWYSKTLSDTLRTLGICELDLKKVMDLVKHEYDRKYFDREAALCFFSDLSLVDDGEHAGYEQFCENIGGELARWSLKKREPEIYKLLKENGEQIIVKFILPFSNIADFQKDIIVYQFVSYVSAKYFWSYNYKIQFDGMTTSCVAPDRILELIPYTREIDY